MTLFTRPVLAVLLTFCTVSVQANQQSTPLSPTDVVQRFLHGIVERTNIERVNRGIGPLKVQEDLTRAAFQHARDMASLGYFAHATPAARQGAIDYEEYARRQNYAGGTGENLYHGPATPSPMISLWMESATHRSNILEPRYSETGFGVARGRDAADTFCVQFFGMQDKRYPIVINNEAYSTERTTVHLYLYGRGKVKQVRFSENGRNFTSWEPFHSEREWTFSKGDGPRTIYVEMSDGRRTYRSADSIYLNVTHSLSIIP